MTQLGELRDAYERFQESGVKLYAVSYDDVEALRDFAAANAIPFPLLSDTGSAVIRRYGILNTLVDPSEAPFYGIPFPGTYVVDEHGIVIEKFFPRHLANRESADAVLDGALGRILMGDDGPLAGGGMDGIRLTVTCRGGSGTLKSGIRRRIIVRFELPDGLHIYGEPAPDGMVATTVTVRGPDGLIVEDVLYPPTTPLSLPGLDAELHVWSGTVDIAVPVWANSRLIDLFRSEEGATATITVTVRYQACNDTTCRIPRTETLTVTVPIESMDIPNIPGTGLAGRLTSMDSMAHLKRLLRRFE